MIGERKPPERVEGTRVVYFLCVLSFNPMLFSEFFLQPSSDFLEEKMLAKTGFHLVFFFAFWWRTKNNPVCVFFGKSKHRTFRFFFKKKKSAPSPTQSPLVLLPKFSACFFLEVGACWVVIFSRCLFEKKSIFASFLLCYLPFTHSTSIYKQPVAYQCVSSFFRPKVTYN